MSKKLAIFLCLIFVFWNLPQINRAFADSVDCSNIPLELQFGYNLNGLYYDAGRNSTFPQKIDALFFTFTGSLTEGATYRFRADYDLNPNHDYSNEAQASNGRLELATNDRGLLKNGTHKGVLEQKDSKGWHDPPYCTNIKYEIGNNYTDKSCQITFKSYLNGVPPPNQPIYAIISKAATGKNYKIIYTNGLVDESISSLTTDVDDNGNGEFTFYAKMPQDKASIEIINVGPQSRITICQKTFNISATTQPITGSLCFVSPDEPDFTTPIAAGFINSELGKSYKAVVINNETGKEIRESGTYQGQANNFIKFEYADPTARPPVPPLTLPEGNYLFQIIQVNPTTDKPIACASPIFKVKGPGAIARPNPKACTGSECALAGGDTCTTDPNNPGFKTAIGCIHTSPAVFVKDLLTFLLGISGGLAFLMMLIGAFQMLTSAGNPETLQAGRERLTSAVIGLLIVIFAVLLLQIIGLDILHIPGFGR